MWFQHHRHQIWNLHQHPYKHSLAEFSYVNPALPQVTNIESAINFIVAVLYPNAKPAVATPAALPLVGNTLNDYRVVLDDGDGNFAAYRWEQREGEASPSWHKVMDMDWSSDSILAALTDVTLDLYVHKDGRTDVDGNGDPIVGVYAGQTVYGGDTANQNLTLRANSGDGVGPSTGFVQVDDQFRPAVHNSFDFGTNTERWKDGYLQGTLLVGTLSLGSGSITDSSGSISFGDENLSTTGNIDGAIITASDRFVTGTMTVDAGSITDTSGAISFGDENLSTTGTISGASGSTFGTLTLADGSITDSSGAISFDNENLSTTGTLGAGATTVTQLDADNLRLDGNTLSSTDTNGNITLSPDGTGIVDILKTLQTLAIDATGTVTVTGNLAVDNIDLNGNAISITDANGSLTLSANGSGHIITTSLLRPNADATLALGNDAFRFSQLRLSGNVGDGTNQILMSELLSLRNILFQDAARTMNIADGDVLFWNAASQTFLASAPDTEVDHGSISGLLDDDHTQYALLAGRTGGQILIGGSGASNNLTLESTSNATKGQILVRDNLAPETNASFSGGWSGTDIGGPTNYFRDLYTRGELRGARLENFTSGTLPAASAQNIGRVVFATDNNKAYVDIGSQFKVLGVSKFVQDTVWNGTDTTKDINVSSDITDARLSIWAFHDNANDFDRIYAEIKAISATTVRINVSPALPAGSYRLIGIE